MARTAIDTSVIVAALLSWHEAHEPAFTALDTALDEHTLILPLSALIESYAVLTRLPAPHRLRPSDAAALLETSFRASGRVSSQRAGAAWGFLGALVREDVRGGATYDRRILEEARAAGAERLLTLNAADFRRFAVECVTVVEPGEP